MLKILLFSLVLGFVNVSWALEKTTSMDQPEAKSGADFRVDTTNIPSLCACNYNSSASIGENTNPSPTAALDPKTNPTAK